MFDKVKFKPHTPIVTFDDAVYGAFQRGVNTVINAIRPTIGPTARATVIERHSRDQAPELLDNGGVIARRIIEVDDMQENVGAMFVRGMLWDLHEQVGDGTATAAVIFQSVYNAGVRYLVAGGNAMRLREHLTSGIEEILAVLDEQTRPVVDVGQLRQIACSLCHDVRDLPALLAEIIDILGEYGHLEIHSGYRHHPEWEYIEGAYWQGGLYTKQAYQNTATQRTEFAQAHVMISDLDIEKPNDLVHVLRAALQAKIDVLYIIANKFSEQALGVIDRSKASSRMRVIPIKTPANRL